MTSHAPGEIIPGKVGYCRWCGHPQDRHESHEIDPVNLPGVKCRACVAKGLIHIAKYGFAPAVAATLHLGLQANCSEYEPTYARATPWPTCSTPGCGHTYSSHFGGNECTRTTKTVVPPSKCACEEYTFPDGLGMWAVPDPSLVSETTSTEPSINDRKDTPTMTDPMKYTLPDGREYVSRALGGYKSDVEGLRDLAKMGKHILLLGEPGCGKTALHQVAFPDSENEVGHSKMTAWDMLWRPRPMPDGSIVYDPSPLTRAVTRGVPFYLDETMRLSEDAFTPLFSAMDGRGFIVGGNLDGTDLPVKPGFVVIGASNPLVRGAFLPDAIASRFHILTVETSEELLVKMGLDERLLVAWRNLSSMDGGDTWRPSIREMLAAQSFIDAGNMPQAAYALTGWRVPARDRAVVAGVIAPLLGVRVSDLGGVIR